MSSDPLSEREYIPSGTSGTTVFVAFLAGAAIGAVAALLTTPKSGSEMRATLRDWAKSFSDGEGEQANEPGREREHTRPMGTHDRPAGT